MKVLQLQTRMEPIDLGDTPSIVVSGGLELGLVLGSVLGTALGETEG